MPLPMWTIDSTHTFGRSLRTRSFESSGHAGCVDATMSLCFSCRAGTSVCARSVRVNSSHALFAGCRKTPAFKFTCHDIILHWLLDGYIIRLRSSSSSSTTYFLPNYRKPAVGRIIWRIKPWEEEKTTQKKTKRQVAELRVRFPRASKFFSTLLRSCFFRSNSSLYGICAF